ncbi:MAG: hypothetical protein R3F36_05860 [Candidatus Competibacteraceae bacterium]
MEPEHKRAFRAHRHRLPVQFQPGTRRRLPDDQTALSPLPPPVQFARTDPQWPQ